MTFEADITNFKRSVKEKKLSFTMAMVYAVCKCANEIEAFRYRFLEGKVVLFDKIDTAWKKVYGFYDSSHSLEALDEGL